MARPLTLGDLLHKQPPADVLALAIASAGLPVPVREHRFHPKRMWRFDLAWPAQMVALEVDGGTWSGGRHTRGKGFREDCRKLNTAAILGWRVLRVTPDMIKAKGAQEALAYVRAIMP